MRSIVIHGGIAEFEGGDARLVDYRNALRDTVASAYEILKPQGTRAAVLHAIRLLEDNELFNAGTGSRIQADGEIRMSAALMNGNDKEFTGVVNIQYVKNPIDVAASLAGEKYKVLAGDEATAYARTVGFDSYYPYTNHRLNEFRNSNCDRDGNRAKTGTVGAVAIDDSGTIFAATSTGGVGGETPGRVSDSATVAGSYASDKMGISLTGVGEEIVNHAAAARVATRVDDQHSLSAAAEITILEARKLNYLYGLIAIDHTGQCVAEQTRGTLLWASQDGSNTSSF